MQYFTTELVSQEVSKLRSDSVSTVQHGKASSFSCFLYPPLLSPELPYTEREESSRRPHQNLLWAGRSRELRAPQEHNQVDKALRQSLAPFPWCSMGAGRKAQPTLNRKRLGNSPLRSQPCTYIGAKRDYHNCPPLSTE